MRKVLAILGLAMLDVVFLAAPSAARSQAAPPPPASDAAAPDPRPIIGAPRGAALRGAALEQRTEEVAGLLRCPVCQGLSVADSPSSMAIKMRHQVRDLLAAGYDREQILRYFESSYGEFVRLEPPLRGVNWVVWLAPGAGLLAGAALVGWALRKPRDVVAPDSAGNDVPGPDTLPDDAVLAAYVRRVREMAYGWPGGVRPPGGA